MSRQLSEIALHQDSFSEIARLLTDFFRDLDLVPTDIVAGLVLLRKHQKELQETKVNQVRVFVLTIACSE